MRLPGSSGASALAVRSRARDARRPRHHASPPALSAMTERKTIRVEVADKVATLTLNRPERLNAYTVEMGIELFGAFAELDDRDDVRAIIVTGEGRAFCAGADLESGGKTFARQRAWQAARELEERTRSWNLRTPIIAAINGAAVGIGATLPLQWDIRLAS